MNNEVTSKPLVDPVERFRKDCDQLTQGTIAVLTSDKSEADKKEWVKNVASLFDQMKGEADPLLLQQGFTEKAISVALTKSMIIRVSQDKDVSFQQAMLLEPLRRKAEDQLLSEQEKTYSLILIERILLGLSPTEAYVNVIRRHFQEMYPQLNAAAMEGFLILLTVRAAKCDRVKISREHVQVGIISPEDINRFAELVGEIEEAVQIMVGEKEMPSI